MSVAPAAPLPLPPPRPGLRRDLIFRACLAAAVLLAIPAGAFALSNNELSQAHRLVGLTRYAAALDHYRLASSVAGNVFARPLLGGIANKARAGAAETEYDWGKQEQGKGDFAFAEKQYSALVHSGLPTWQVRGNEALADLYLAWGNSLVNDQKFDTAIPLYRRVKDYDRAGRLKTQTAQAMAAAYSAYAAWLVQAKPPDYPNAISWYQNLIKDFPDSAEAKQAAATLLPQTLYDAAQAYIGQQRYDQARDAMRQIVKDYPGSSVAPKASAALAAPQEVSGRLIQPDGTAVPNRLLRISTKWKIVSPHTYDDSDGQIFSTTTDANGAFRVLMPPGQNYLVTWWDPSRQNFVTTFIGDDMPVNQVSVPPLQPSQISVTIA